MTKILDFLKTNLIVIKWTVGYFFVLWAVLWYLFHFDMFSQIHWWKFFHAHLRGFIGLVFAMLIYTAIPIYIATTAIVYRTKKPIFTIPFCDKVIEYIKKMFSKPEQVTESEPETEPEIDPDSEYPDDLPNELKVPFRRIKQRLAFTNMSYAPNKTTEPENTLTEPEPELFPLPTDFDIGDSLPDTSVPTFTDINFDTPAPTPTEPETKTKNAVTKYFDEHKIDYETYNNFTITHKQVIYVHDDPDFWIMDNDTWFAAGKQTDSPIPTLLKLAKDNGLTPIIYFESTNIMDFEGTIQQMNLNGIKTITDLSELN
ncbi:MAG: hypothetical protein IJL05_01180 [Alphaproteobacteria bacterium]|nr:hypothetical protein [Alphaproteobacteria bacterium]